MESYGLLVKEAIVLLDKFKPHRQCLDDFIEDASKDLKNMKNLHKTFIFDVVSGCTEHKKLLDIVINVFYDQNQRCLFRHERSQFVVICYLTIFALNDLGLRGFKDIVKSLDIKKMQKFLTFFFKNLTTWIQAKWNNIYDAAYVEEHWIGPVLRWRPEIETLMEQVSVESCQRNMFKKVPIKTTVVKEFSFTKPKPRHLPMPEVIPQQKKTKPVPASTYRAPKEIQKIKETKLKNQQVSMELFYEANVKQFQCVKPQMSEQTKRKMSQIKADSDSKHQLNPSPYSKPPANNKTNSTPIKVSRAIILRQEAKEKRQVEKEKQRVEHLAEGTLEPSAFHQWQKESHAKDVQAEREKIHRRFIQGRIDDGQGATARKHLVEHNQRAAQLKKEETAELLRTYAVNKLKDKKEIKALVQQVAEGHINTKAAKEKLQRLKQSIVKEVSVQNQALLRKALEEAQAELIGKFETVQESHAIESVPLIRPREYDDTNTAGSGLLGEMSRAELDMRLFLLKDKNRRELQEKRERILAVKQEEKRQMQLKIEKLEKHRNFRIAEAKAAAIRWRPEIETLMEQVSVESCQRNMFKKVPIKTTVVKEFSFTKPKPRPLPMPEVIPQQKKNKPVPASTYRAPKEIQKIKETKLKNQQVSMELFYEANVKQFQCVKPQMSEQTKRKMSQIKADSDSKHQLNPSPYSKPPANNKTNSTPVKVSRAIILRQEAKEKRQVEKEKQRVEHLAEGTLEPSAFHQWQKESHAKDVQAEREKIHRRFIQGRIDDGQGATARKHLVEHNQRAAQLKKEETAELLRTYAVNKLKDKKEIKALVQQVAEGHINTKAAKEKLQRLKQSIVKEVSVQNQALLRKALEEAQAELIGKFQTVQESHAIESVPLIRPREYDDTNTAGSGLLGEMSRAELDMRLFLLKDKNRRELQEKQERILAVKQEEKRQMQLKIEKLEKHRNFRIAEAKAAAIRKEEERNARLRREEAVRQSESMLALRREAEAKKQEHQRMRAEDRQRMKDFFGKKTKTSQQAVMHTERKTVKVKTLEEIVQGLESFNLRTYGSYR